MSTEQGPEELGWLPPASEVARRWGKRPVKPKTPEELRAEFALAVEQHLEHIRKHGWIATPAGPYYVRTPTPRKTTR